MNNETQERNTIPVDLENIDDRELSEEESQIDICTKFAAELYNVPILEVTPGQLKMARIAYYCRINSHGFVLGKES